MTRRVVAFLVGVIVVAACTSPGGPILANPPAPQPPIPQATALPSLGVDPVPVDLPRDDGPHDRLTEWWYYTGHLRKRMPPRSLLEARTYGFEFVIFRAERGAFPTTWASHLAITDEGGDRFHYAQRSQVGEAVDRSPRDDDGVPTGFELALTGIDPTDPSSFDQTAWTMTGGDGTDHIEASVTTAEATAQATVPIGLDLTLHARKPPALHDVDGWIDFGPGGGSYYYSRTDMGADGDITVDGKTFDVDGTAWFDHQWGDFITVGGGGWDWFAVNLDDGTDITLSLVRDADGSYPLIYGTLVRPDGTTEHLARDAFQVTTSGSWTSPASGATYPAGWSVAIPGEQLTIELAPTVAAQELDTRPTTGVVYWEGSQEVTARRAGKPLGGEAYVELTGYAPAGTNAPPAP